MWPFIVLHGGGLLRLHCLFYLDRGGLGKLCQTARTQASHVRIDVASLDPALHWERKWIHTIDVRNSVLIADVMREYQKKKRKKEAEQNFEQ